MSFLDLLDRRSKPKRPREELRRRDEPRSDEPPRKALRRESASHAGPGRGEPRQREPGIAGKAAPRMVTSETVRLRQPVNGSAAPSHEGRKAHPEGRRQRSIAERRRGADLSHDVRRREEDRRRDRKQPQLPSDEDALEVIAGAGELLSDLGGDAQPPASIDGRVAYFESGLLCVLAAHASDHDIASYERLLGARGYPITRRLPVSIEVMERALEGTKHATRGSAQLTANMQKVIIQEITAAAEANASDIHIELTKRRTRVQWRVAGDLQQAKEWHPDKGEAFLQAIFAMCTNTDATYVAGRPQAAQMTNVTAALPPGVVALRLQFSPISPSGRYLVIRLLYSGTGVSTDLCALGYTEDQVEMADELLGFPNGIVLVTGPTGSGKSTTLQRYIMRYLKNTGDRARVITVEDPPEREIPGAIQIPVAAAGENDSRSHMMQEAINAMMRSDPDAGMVGEIRDLPTASLAIEMAMTGHPVMTTLHTNDAISAIDRLLDIGVEPYKVLDCTLIRGMIAQRLIRKLCQHCSVPAGQARAEGRISDREWERILSVTDLGRDNVRAAGHGCEHCSSGYQNDRTVVAEIVMPDERFMRLMGEHRKLEARSYWLANLRGRSMMDHAILKLRAGVLDHRQIERSLGPLELELPEGLAHSAVANSAPGGVDHLPAIAPAAGTVEPADPAHQAEAESAQSFVSSFNLAGVAEADQSDRDELADPLCEGDVAGPDLAALKVRGAVGGTEAPAGMSIQDMQQRLQVVNSG